MNWLLVSCSIFTIAVRLPQAANTSVSCRWGSRSSSWQTSSSGVVLPLILNPCSA